MNLYLAELLHVYNNLQTNVVIRITDFCDTNDNEYVSVDLLLNKGGIFFSLIYIDNDSTDNTDGYWMFLNNSYTYALTNFIYLNIFFIHIYNVKIYNCIL